MASPTSEENQREIEKNFIDVTGTKGFPGTPLLEKKEAVNHPSHYGGDTVYEVIKVLKAWGLHRNAYLWNAVKYIARAGKKDPSKQLEDLKKARFYLDAEIAELESKKLEK